MYQNIKRHCLYVTCSQRRLVNYFDYAIEYGMFSVISEKRYDELLIIFATLKINNIIQYYDFRLPILRIIVCSSALI